MLLAAFEFIAAMIVVQLRYPGYSDISNYISDLGGPHSPWRIVFNVSIIILGLLTLLATYLLAAAFNKRASRTVGLFFLALVGIGSILVGTFPENSPELGGNIHGIVSDLTFISAGLALVILPAAMLRDTRWDGFRGFTFLMGIITFVAIVLFTVGDWGPLGPGGMERLIVAPILLWAIVVGIHLLSLPTYRPAPIAHSTAP
jgi:hypothetical membrane protein